MYTFCSFLQEVLKKAFKIAIYRDLIELLAKVPSWKASSNLEIIKSLSALANAILASKSRLLDWITSRVVLVLPESYSSVIPSFAISAAFNWASVAINTLSEDWYLDHEFVVWVTTSFSASLDNNKDLEEILKLGILVVVDETYFEFCGSTSVEMIKNYENLIILRSFSKWAGIAGLRIGYMLANSEIIDNVFKVKQPYNINVVAEKAAILTLENRIDLQFNIEKILSEKKVFAKFIDNLDGVNAFSSDANFILCKFSKSSPKYYFL